jgi:two-component system chemotaxis sensor kinase CheA
MKHETAKTNAEVAGAEKAVIDAKSAQSVRVRFDQLDKLMNFVGELVINKIALLQVTAETKNDGLKRISENIDRLTADLQDLVTRVRMVPIGQIFDRFPRLVRDLSLKKGKEVNLIMSGKEIEVDRTVLDEIGEPLIHLLRNCVDHGIESADERKRCGKDQAGRILLSARRKEDHVFVEVEDDGQGIDPEKVKRAAIGKGFISEIEAEKMSVDQLINLVFLPGLSTAKEVTETSGRGVGLDVVRTKIGSLGGTVLLETRVGTGTKVTIKLPLTLAIIRVILVRDLNQSFAIPISQVSEIVNVDRTSVKSLGNFEAINIRGHVVPLFHLHDLLNLKDDEEAEKLEVLITYLGDEDKKLGLIVDSVERQQEILIKSLSEDISKIRGITGATILGDGQVVLVLDVPLLVERKNRSLSACAPQSASIPIESPQFSHPLSTLA